MPVPARRRAFPLALLVLSCCLSAAPRAGAQAGGAGPDEVTVATDVFEITFSRLGAVPVRWTVVDRMAGAAEAPVRRRALIDAEYLAASAWRPLGVVTDAAAAADLRPFELRRSEAGGATVLEFTSPVAASGLQIKKTYTVAPGHVLSLRVELRNTGSSALVLPAPGLTVGPGLGPAGARDPDFEEGRDPTVLAFFETEDGVFDAWPEAAEGEAEGEAGAEGAAPAPIAWGGVAAQYFLMAVVPREAGGQVPPFVDLTVQLESSAEIDRLVPEADREAYPRVALAHAARTLPPGATAAFAYDVYAGPKDRSVLAATGLGLEAVLFHHLWSWLASVCLALQDLLAALHGVLGNWGLAIVVFALLFRLVTLPLSLYGARSALLMQAKMADLKPLVAELKTKHKGNADKLNEAILRLYKEHGINPFSHFKGCLPLLIQLPVLIALFQLLLNSYDLRGAGFLWIDDLTLTDRLLPLPFTIPWLGSYVNLLPLIMFAAMIVVGRSMRVPGRAEQASGGLRYGMPIAMTLLFYPFPSGCMLFWTTGNLLQIAEQRRTAARVAAHLRRM